MNAPGHRKSSLRILIAAGGSGGHIFPSIALAERLREKESSVRILFVGANKRLDRNIFTKEHLAFRLLSANKMPYRISWKIVLFVFLLFWDCLKACKITALYQPHVVVCFGGYVSAPVAFAAKLFRVPIVAHEQNVIPGRANRFLFAWATRIAISFKETKRLLGREAIKAVFTGNPIRDRMSVPDKGESINKLGLDNKKFTILVIGGSQGARTLNERFIDAMASIDRETKPLIQVIHITGVADYEYAIKAYGAMGVKFRVYSFIDEIYDAYNASDLVITRSGASALFEIAHYARPMVLVPYPHAMNHQKENARVFIENGAAIGLDEKDLSAKVFKDTIMDLMNNTSLLAGLGKAAKSMSVLNSACHLADIVLGQAAKGIS